MTTMNDDRPTPAGATAPAGSTIWEPAGGWQPKLRDRVICRPSPECRLVSEPGSLQGDAGDIGHEAWETGLTGVIEHVLTDEDAGGEPGLVAQGHVWEVLWDRPHRYAGRQCCGASYALGELVPVDVGEGEGKRRCARSVQW